MFKCVKNLKKDFKILFKARKDKKEGKKINIKGNNLHTIIVLTIALIGFLGIHRFITGKIVSGIFYLLTFGGLGLWTLYDMYFVFTGCFTDKEGNRIKPYIEIDKSKKIEL